MIQCPRCRSDSFYSVDGMYHVVKCSNGKCFTLRLHRWFVDTREDAIRMFEGWEPCPLHRVCIDSPEIELTQEQLRAWESSKTQPGYGCPAT